MDNWETDWCQLPNIIRKWLQDSFIKYFTVAIKFNMFFLK